MTRVTCFPFNALPVSERGDRSAPAQTRFGQTGRLARAVLILLGLTHSWTRAQTVGLDPVQQAKPPLPPPAVTVQRPVATGSEPAARGWVLLSSAPVLTTPYSIGEPTDLEQLYLEYINRARRNPGAEGARLRNSTDSDVRFNLDSFSVDLDLLASALAALPPAPPLSMNAQLTAAARRHSRDMLANGFQAHDGSDGSTIASRITESGYGWTNVGENIFAYSISVEHGHAGLEVDWGDAPDAQGGMQNPPGHRLNIHSLDFREMGVGLLSGTNGLIGPWVLTQDFGSSPDAPAFVTGVVYYDFNGNKFYDPNEGVGGVTVVVNGAAVSGISAGSGGYSVPVPGDGTYGVTFRVPGLADVSTSGVVSGGNVKVDHILSYAPPAVSGPDRALVGQQNGYTFTPVGGATAYQWKWSRLVAATGGEGAETGLAKVTPTTTAGYAVIDTLVRSTGAASFHLAHPRTAGTNSPPEDQFLLLNKTFRGRTGAQLVFASRLSWATSNQVARAQITLDGGVNWLDVWSQPGVDNAGETSFRVQSIPLPTAVGREFRVRFVYDYLGGGFFFQADPAVGFHIDDITLTSSDELVEEQIGPTANLQSFDFIPASAGPFELSVRAQLVNRYLPWGTSKPVVAEVDSRPTVRLIGVQRLGNGAIQIGFAVTNPGTAGYQVQGATDLTGSWAVENGATVTAGAGTGAFNALVPAGAGQQRFYRVFAH